MPIEISTNDGSLSIDFYGLTEEQEAFAERHLKDSSYQPKTVRDCASLVQKLIKDNEGNWDRVRDAARNGALVGAVGGGVVGGIVGAVIAGPPGAGVGFFVGAAGCAPVGAVVGSSLVVYKNYSNWMQEARKKGLLDDFRNNVLTPMIESQVDSPLGDYICGITLFLPSQPAITPCGHRFHLPELLETLDRTEVCPTCRKQCKKKDVRFDQEGMKKIEEVTKRKLKEIIKYSDLSNKNHEKWMFFKEGLEAIIKDIKDKKRADITAAFKTVLEQEDVESMEEALKVLSTEKIKPEKEAQKAQRGPEVKLPSPQKALMQARRCRGEAKVKRSLNFDSTTVVVK